MINEIYNKRILELAANIPHLGALENPQVSATAHSKLCGSTVKVELRVTRGVVTHFAHDVKACALGQASSSIMAHNIIGATPFELRELRENATKMLKENGAPPQGKWQDVEVLLPVREYKARHASTLLTFDAVCDALDKIPTLVFDLDGTLVDTAADLIGTLSWLMQKEGLPQVDISQAKSLIGAGMKPMIIKALQAQGRGETPEEIERVYGDYLVEYEANLTTKSRPYPYLLKQLEILGEDNLLAVCTNKIERLARPLLAQLNMTHYFQAITGVDTFAFKKPDARHLIETVKRAGGNPNLAIMVGDSKTDINTAKNAGVPSIGFRQGYTDIPLEELEPTLILEDYATLAQDIAGILKAY
jgi:phosphoglycolate phosphatase